MPVTRTLTKPAGAALVALALFATSCGGSSATDGDVVSGAVATAVPTEVPEEAVSAATEVPAADEEVATTDEEQRNDSYQSLIDEGQFDPDEADCVLDGLHERTDSYDLDLDPALDPSVAQGLTEMVLECQGIAVPAGPSTAAPTSDLTIEEWRQNAGDLTPEERNGLYAEVGYPPMTIDTSSSYVAVMTTAAGEMRFQLSAADAPITVNNFVNLAEDGYFDGVTFHRVIEGFMAQGGDPSGSGSGGPGYQFINEFTEGVEFVERGQLAMANAGANTNGSQFFITFEPSGFLGGANYTIFGELLDGDDILAAVDIRDPGSAVDPGTIIESVRIEVS